MTPQQLIDLPGYGSAKKQLLKEGRWVLTPLEILWQISEDHCAPAATMLINNAIKQLEATCN